MKTDENTPSEITGQLQISNNVGKLTSMGLVLNEDTSFEDWKEMGHKLVRVAESSLFWIGDWINFGKHKYGEKYKAAMEILGYNYQSCANIAAVCRNVPSHMRRRELKFTHHREVAGLSPELQTTYLERAVTERLSVIDMRQTMRRDFADQTTDSSSSSRQKSAFSIVDSLGSCVRWFKREIAKQPIESWSKERRAALACDLRPLVRIYEQLTKQG